MNLPLLHVKWFIENHGRTPAPIFDFSLKNPSILTWLLIVIFLVSLAYILDRKIKPPKENFLKKSEITKPQLLHLFQILVGMSLLFASHRGAILQPHFSGTASTQLLQIAEMASGILLIANVAVPFAAILLLITYLGTVYFFSFFEAIDYINLLGIAAFLYLWKTKNSKLKKYHYLGLPLLRIFTGLALFILAFSEKLLFTYKAEEFLHNYHLNFMQNIGFSNFSDHLFILSAGAMEAAFGLILIFGFITRINIAVLTTFFLASNIYFFVQGYFEEGIIELTGHLPIIATVIILLVYGSGTLLEKSKA